MKAILYIVAIVLFIGWLVGVLLDLLGGLIHILLILALVAIVLSFIKRKL